jgi:hypothetical protein
MAAVAVDFDGVLHRYSKGWQDGSIYGEPMPGAGNALRLLLSRYAVFIHTTRDAVPVAEWIGDQFTLAVTADAPGNPREFWDVRGLILVTRRKYPAVAYIDDRGIRFENWDQSLADLARFTGSGSAASA